jgi:DNA invertase Pin-like site-specific DNA recombinase
MNLIEPLIPKDPSAGLRVIILGRISTAGQDAKSIDSQQDQTERRLRAVYSDPITIRRLGDQASGWAVDRECLNEAQALIESGEWDLVMVGELREIYRNPQFQWAFVQGCMDNDVRFISVAEGIDTADEEWEARMHFGSCLSGMAGQKLGDGSKGKQRVSSQAAEWS